MLKVWSLQKYINVVKGFVLVSLIALVSCVHSHQPTGKVLSYENKTQASDYHWVKVLDSSSWKKNYNFQMFSLGNGLWTFHPDGNWYSNNDSIWVKSPLPNILINHAFLDYVPFKGEIFALGYFTGNIEHFTFKPEIQKTVNLNSWLSLSKESNLPQRFFYHPFVFDHKIWIIGGEDKTKKYSDIWNSTDGIHWIKQRDSLEFGPRSGSQVVMLRDSLYLLDNDVWASKDGLSWTKVVDEIVKGETIFGYAALSYDDRIWLLGCNRNGQFTSQVLFSHDGRTWKALEAPWLPRGGIAATVHQNRIYMTGGKYGGTPDHPNFRYDNDLWYLERK